ERGEGLRQEPLGGRVGPKDPTIQREQEDRSRDEISGIEHTSGVRCGGFSEFRLRRIHTFGPSTREAWPPSAQIQLWDGRQLRPHPHLLLAIASCMLIALPCASAGIPHTALLGDLLDLRRPAHVTNDRGAKI